jgi:anaphase-promoting complex subunit 11
MEVKIVNWNYVASWKFALQFDKCVICQQRFEDPCPRCKLPGENCIPVTGACTHQYHLHCIDRWSHDKVSCPICKRDWKLASN